MIRRKSSRLCRAVSFFNRFGRRNSAREVSSKLPELCTETKGPGTDSGELQRLKPIQRQDYQYGAILRQRHERQG